MAVDKQASFRSIGKRNVQVKDEGDFLTIRIAKNAAAIQSAPLSSTGKNKLVADTGGWQTLPGSDPQMRLMVGLTTPPATEG